MFSNRRNIRQIKIDGSEYKEAVRKLQNAVALDFDIKTSMVYWTEASAQKIQRARLGQNAATNIENVLEHGQKDATCIAVDWVARNMYWATEGGLKLPFVCFVV